MRKGERGSLVVYADKIIRTETDTATGEEAERAIPFMKGYTVFNVQQIDGLPEHYCAKPEPRTDAVQRIDRAEAFFAGTRAIIRHGGTMAHYNARQDFVQLPSFESFRDAESYYATLAHETTHWTRHKSRLDRDFGRKRFGDESYAVEELVAELASAFLSSDLDLTPELRGGSRLRYRVMDQGPERRQARDLHRRIPRPARRGFLARLAEIRIRLRGRRVSVRHGEANMIIIGDRAFHWHEICDLYRQQLEAWKAAQPRQLALFELKDNRRPAGRTDCCQPRACSQTCRCAEKARDGCYLPSVSFHSAWGPTMHAMTSS
jgi:Zincin-like metallopeptidase/N-terminal domain of anti-restriction factor ArdC